MTRRIVDGPLAPGSLVGETPDPASGALVVLCGPAAADPAAAAPPDEQGRAGREGSRPSDGRCGRILAELEEEILRRFGARRCRLRFRPNAPPGETALAAVVRAPHRRDAFEAARWAVAEARRRLSGPPARGGDADGAPVDPGEAAAGSGASRPDPPTGDEP